jgi:cytoskeletal protein CcmA (bactofilin family)
VVGANLRVTGDLTSDGELQLDGSVQGNVRGKMVTVGQSGSVVGEIHADTVRVLGKVQGPITGKVVELARSGHVTGEVRHETLTIEAGAYIDGHCRRLDAEARNEERLALVHNKGKAS